MADNSEMYQRIVADWRTALAAVRGTGCQVITIPVLDLQMILDSHAGDPQTPR